MNQNIRHLAMYLRISQEKKNEDFATLENHRQLLKDYCERNKYTFVEFGEVISGGKTELEDRPELQNLLNRIEEFDAVLVVELSRLSRNGLISQTVKQYCIDYDKPILTPYQTYDLANNENDRLMFDVGSMISSHEHSIIGKRSKTNKIQLAKQGFHISGGVPFGYIRNPKTKKLEIDKEAAKTIRYIFELHSQGYGSYKIRDILNEEGYSSATGKHFNLPSIKRIIRNEHYKGWTIFQDRKRIKKNGKVTYEVQDTIVVKNTHPAIIPPEEWDKANRDRIERSNKAKMTREKPVVKSEVTMLKDLIYCGICGKKMSIRLDQKSATGYTIMKCQYLLPNGDKCPNSGIREVFVEEFLHKELIEFAEILQTDVDELRANGKNKMVKIQQQRITQLNKKLKGIMEQEKKLIDLALSGLFSNEEIYEKKQEILSMKSNLQSQIELLQKEIDVSSINEEIEKKLEVIEIISNMRNKSPEYLNQQLKTFIKRIEYKRLIPDDLKKVSTRNKDRQNVKFTLDIETYV